MSKITLLLVEDDLNLGTLLFDQLKMNGYTVKWAQNGRDGLQKFHHYHPEICVVDLMMPEMDGVSFIRNIRESDPETPTIVITAKDTLEDKSESFQSGADDYLCKPFEIEELLLRIEARLRRRKEPNSPELAFGDYVLNIESRALHWEQKIIQVLTDKECMILHLLAKRPGEVVSRHHILESVWGSDSPRNSRSLDVFMSRLRKYLSNTPTVCIRNIHGKGYLLSLQ